jgi:hypothetical protein
VDIGWTTGIKLLAGAGIFFLCQDAHTAFLGAVQPFSPAGSKVARVKLTTLFHLVPRPRIHGDLPPHLLYSLMAWCVYLFM